MSAPELSWSLADMPPSADLEVSRPERGDPIPVLLAYHRLRAQQVHYLMPQFLEALQDEQPVKYKSGVHFAEQADLAARTRAEFDEIGDLHPDYLYPPSYRESHVKDSDLSFAEHMALFDVKQNRRERLTAAATRWNTESRDIFLPPGLLNDPPYLRQGDKAGVAKSGGSGCLNACFRMVYQAVTGEALADDAVSEATFSLLKWQRPSDDIYLKVFRTNAFRTMRDAKVTPVTIGGAGFADIESLTSRLKNAKASLGVYAIVLLASEQKEGVWHANMLLAADADTVVVHDPSDLEHGASYRRLDRQAFYQRWSMALNKTHLVVVDKPTAEV